MLGHRTLNVEDYLSILKRRWWIIVLFTVVFTIGAIGFTYFVTPKYVSETLVLIDQQKVPTDFVQPVATQSLDSRLAIITTSGPSINGTGMIRPGAGTGAAGGTAKITAGVISGSSFRPKHIRR